LHEKRMREGHFEEYYEDCAYRASKKMLWHGLVKEDLAWSEIDKKEDIERAINVLKKIDSYS